MQHLTILKVVTTVYCWTGNGCDMFQFFIMLLHHTTLNQFVEVSHDINICMIAYDVTCFTVYLVSYVMCE